MKFGAHLKSVQLPVWRYYYIDYDLLKKKVKEMSKLGKDCPIEDEADFVEFLNRELDKVASFQCVKSGELHRRAEHCEAIIKNIFSNLKSNDIIHLDKVEEEMYRITNETNHLSKFTRLNYTGFLKILKKHDKHTSFELKSMFIAKLNARPFFRETFDELILKLSLLYDTIRNQGQPSSKKDGEDNVSQSFVRQTTKFWVHPDNVTEVKLRILKYLPVLIFGSKREYDPAISSVYFDNDQFELYKGRLEKTHGAQAVRFRWYGNSGQQEIFAERKTHREDWTGEKSVKERFPIKEKCIDAYLKKEWMWDSQMQKMLKKKEKPESVLMSMLHLATELQSTIQSKQLKPMLRTFYNRTAFQLPGDASVRISLDTELTMIREDNYDDKVRSGSHWRRTDIGTNWPFNDLDPSDIHRFPYAVLEVKLQTQLGFEPPSWVQELVQSHLVEAVPKFSKFVHGCATLFENRVELLPFWIPQMDQDIRKPPLLPSFHFPSFSSTSSSLLPPPSHPSPAPPLPAFEEELITLKDTMQGMMGLNHFSNYPYPNSIPPHYFLNRSQISKKSSLISNPVSSKDDEVVVNSTHLNEPPLTSISPGAISEVSLKPQAEKFKDEDEEEEEEDEPKYDESTGLLTLQPKYSTNVLASSSSASSATITSPSYQGILGQILSLMRLLRVSEKKDPISTDVASSIPASTTATRALPSTYLNKRIVVPVRIEPKVFFANERTFLAWLHFAALIAGLALSLLNFGDPPAKLAGCVFCLISIGIMVYALYLFLWRSDKIRNHEPGPYDDRGGPVVIVIILFLAILVNFYLKFTHS